MSELAHEIVIKVIEPQQLSIVNTVAENLRSLA